MFSKLPNINTRGWVSYVLKYLPLGEPKVVPKPPPSKFEMAIAASEVLVAKLSQPATVFTIACISVTILAVSSAWRIQVQAHRKKESKSTFKAPQSSSPRARLEEQVTAILSACSRALYRSQTFGGSNAVLAAIMANLTAELPLTIATLCQIQQLLAIHYTIFSEKPGLQDSLATTLMALSTIMSSLDAELDVNDSPVLHPMAWRNDMEHLLKELHDKTQALALFPENFSEYVDQKSRLLQLLIILRDRLKKSAAVSVPQPNAAKTHDDHLKKYMESPPEEELPEYSPPVNGLALPPDMKKPGNSYPVEIDSNPIEPTSHKAARAAEVFRAIQENEVDALDSLLQNSDPNATHGRLQRTPMHEAARLNRASCATVLIRRGGLVDHDDGKGDSPLHLACWEGNVEVADNLISSGANIDRLSGRDGHAPLFCAIMGRHIDIARLLLKHGARVEVKSPSDMLPLHQAAITGQGAMCELLLDRGANVDCRDREQNTPLHYAATTGNIRTVKVLLNDDSNVNAKQQSGMTPLHWAAHKGHEAVLDALIASGADVNVQSDSFATPLHCAVARNHVGCVKTLLRKGADATITTSAWDGSTGTAQEMALERGLESIYSLLGDVRRDI
jgi:ankyrin repeat protein